MLSVETEWSGAYAASIRGRIGDARPCQRIDPADPFYGNRDGPGQVTPHIGNTKAPVLKPWRRRRCRTPTTTC